MNILIVDDDRLVCQALKPILETQQEIHVVDIGNDGTEAIELYFKHRPDILLMDIRMVAMSGIEAGKQIIVKDPLAKILYLTTFEDNEYIVDAKVIASDAKGLVCLADEKYRIFKLLYVYE